MSTLISVPPLKICEREWSFIFVTRFVIRILTKFTFYCWKLTSLPNAFILKSNRAYSWGWCSGESARLPPMWLGFDSGSVSYTWVKFVIGSHLAPRVLLRVLLFSSVQSAKTNISKIQLGQDREPA